ncbi:hypothetical protein [Candidatus Enterovibrio escicola]|nr:hypothetical protein [Candidatus Enterovibrio escacola]
MLHATSSVADIEWRRRMSRLSKNLFCLAKKVNRYQHLSMLEGVPIS